MKRSATVIGAGIVGICSALQLQRRGFDVTLLDRRPPASETSFGNAGVISRGSVFPTAAPGIYKKLPQILSNRSREARLHYRYLGQLSPWARQLFKNANTEKFEQHVDVLNELVGLCLAEHKALLNECGGLALLRQNGWLKLFRTPESFEQSAAEQNYLTQCGIDFESLGAKQIRAFEASLEPIFAGGLWIKNTASVVSPGQVCELYAKLFTEAGGRIVLDELRQLDWRDDQWQISCAGGEIKTESVVVSLGAWSKSVLENIGYNIPMVVERGYHMHYKLSAELGRPVHDVDGGYVMSPMQKGLRVTTGVEWGCEHASPTPVQLRQVQPFVEQAIDIADEIDPEPWLGRRPCMPDSLPVIGAAPKHRNLWLAFGHGHMGFSMGPVTGRLIAELMTGSDTVMNTDSFSLSRF